MGAWKVGKVLKEQKYPGLPKKKANPENYGECSGPQPCKLLSSLASTGCLSLQESDPALESYQHQDYSPQAWCWHDFFLVSRQPPESPPRVDSARPV